MRSFAGATRVVLALLVTSDAAAAEQQANPAGPAPAAPVAAPEGPAPTGAAHASAASSLGEAMDGAVTTGGADAAARADYDARLRELEGRVGRLRQQVLDSKARLLRLQEIVLRGARPGATAVLLHRNEMSSSFRLVRAQYALDGRPISNRLETGGDRELEDARELEVYAGSLAPGRHRLSVQLEYQGRALGIFAYLDAYRFTVRSSHTFTVEEGRLTTVRVVAYDRGGLTTALEDRPAVRYETEVSLEPAGRRPASAAVPVR